MIRKPSLPRLLRKWQPLLGLDGWTIDVRYRKAMDCKGDLGDCWCEPTNKSSEINISDPLISPHDVEETLVHELLHVSTWWARLNNSRTHRNVVGEQSIETIARALVKLARRK